MKNFSFQIRSVQLDLARQMETLDFIRGFIDFIAQNGFNSLTLYLEGRIRTPAFPFPAREESYSADEMKSIVQYAGTKSIDVIPVISVLGHAELFLKHPELEHLAESGDEVPGRFGPGSKETFCPSHAGTVPFLRSYLSEIAAIFPSLYFHLGSDESWDMNCCPLCRERTRQGESQADLFAKHIQEVHRIIAQELGKRMIIWDDMFEYYPEALAQMPRDLIMACWQYDDKVERTRAHFFHRSFEDALAKYDRLGFDYLICPADYSLSNTESFTSYAAGHRPLGGLLTTWEKSESFLFQSLPLIACVGRRWESGRLNNAGEILKAMGEEIFGCTDEVFLRSIRSLCQGGFAVERRTRVENYLMQRENKADSSRENLVEILLAVLPAYCDQIKESARDILDEILLSLRSEQIAFQLEEVIPRFFEPTADPAENEQRLSELVIRLESVAAQRVAMWHRVRPGIVPCRMKQSYDEYLENLRGIPALAADHGSLRVHFLLPDQYSAQTVRIFIRYAGSSSLEKVAEGVFKELRHFDCFYAKLFLIDKERVPESLKIETEGFGGQGFTFFKVHNALGRFIPAAIENIRGTVTEPANLLRPDWTWSFTGEKDNKISYFEPALATAIHGFEVVLQKQEGHQ